MDKSDAKSSGIPAGHPGIYYKSFLSKISQLRGTRVYLEIGVQAGLLFSEIHADHAVAVDPAFLLEHNIAHHKKSIYLYHDTSDRFFSDPKASAVLGGKIDLAFLDGLHIFEFLLRDFYNTEAFSSKSGLIIMHDCLPLSCEMAIRNEGQAIESGKSTAYPNHWTGDVWKVVAILAKYRPDLTITCLDSHPTGLVCISNLNPDSMFLPDNYSMIVKEFRELPNDHASLQAFYGSTPIQSADAIVDDFDHSLYFRV